MPTSLPSPARLARHAISTVAGAPLAVLATAAALTIVLLVGAVTASAGRLPTDGPDALICATLLAAVALTELSRPARTDRRRASGRTSAAASHRLRMP